MITRFRESDDAAAIRSVLLTGGRAPVTLDLARMLRRAGYRVYVAESASRHLCRLSGAVEQCFVVPSPRHETAAYLSELERIIRASQIDLLLPMCEEVFYIAQGAERLRPYCHVLVSPLEQLHKLHHKFHFIQLAQSMGLAVPDTRLVRSREEWIQTQSVLETEGKWVWKPVYSRFAARVRMPGSRNLPPSEAEISSALPWVAQAYVSGRALCTYSVVHEGNMVAHTTYDSRYRTGSVGASVYFEHVEHEGTYEWVQQFVEATGFSGQIGFDFIEGPEGRVVAIECNPRATSGIHLFYPGDELVRAITTPESLVKEGILMTPKQHSRAMLMLPMLGSGLQQIGRPDQWRAWMAAWRGTRDVVHLQKDRRPMLEQAAVVLSAWRLARKYKLSLTEALTHDIEWNGEQP